MSFALPGLISRSPVVLFCISFAMSAYFWSLPEAIIDSSRYFTQAKHLELYGVSYFLREWGREIPAWTDAPLVPFIYGLVFKIFGESRIYIQIVNSLFYSGTVAMAYLIGTGLRDRETGLAAGAFVMAIPYLYTQPPLMLVDVASMFFLTLSFYLFLRACSKGGALLILLASASILCSMLVKYSLWPMLSALLAVLAVESSYGKRSFRRGLAVMALAGAVACLGFLLKRDVFLDQLFLLWSYQTPGLKRWSESHVSTFLFQIHPLVSAFALYSIYAAIRKKDYRFLPVAWLVLLVFAFGIRRIRYIIPVFPMVALMAAYGLREIRAKNVRDFAVAVAVLASFSVAAFTYSPFWQRQSEANLKTAGTYLDSLDSNGVEVFVLPSQGRINPAVSVPVLDIFTNKRIYYDFDGSAPPKGYETLPTRFSWEYKNPGYYEYDALPAGTPVAVISALPDAGLPPYISGKVRGMKVKAFTLGTDIFEHRNFIRVYGLNADK